MSRNSRIQFQGGLSQCLSDGLHVLLEVLQLLVDHGAEDPLDLGLLQTPRGQLAVNNSTVPANSRCLVAAASFRSTEYTLLLREGRSC